MDKEKNDLETNEVDEKLEDVGDKKRPKKISKDAIVGEIIDWVKTIVFALIFAYLITSFLIVNAKVPSSSMENTVMTGDRLVANRLSYLFSEPERLDIVVFKYPDDESKLFIKRIIGMPGDTVEIRDNEIYINGSDTPLDDGFIKETMETDDMVYEVPDDSYFMLGDNRNQSKDSRMWVHKFVHRDKILGEATFKYYPKIQLLTDK